MNDFFTKSIAGILILAIIANFLTPQKTRDRWAERFSEWRRAKWQARRERLVKRAQERNHNYRNRVEVCAVNPLLMQIETQRFWLRMTMYFVIGIWSILGSLCFWYVYYSDRPDLYAKERSYFVSSIGIIVTFMIACLGVALSRRQTFLFAVQKAYHLKQRELEEDQ